MRSLGLALMIGFGLAAGGIGVGWVAAALEGSHDIGQDVVDVAVAVGSNDMDRMAATGELESRADTALLRTVADRTGALGAELARLRWRVSDARKLCVPASSPGPAVVSEAGAVDPRRTDAVARGRADAPAAVAEADHLIMNPVRADSRSPAAASGSPARTPVEIGTSVPPPPPEPARNGAAPIRLAAAAEPPPAPVPPPAAQVQPLALPSEPPSPPRAVTVEPSAPPDPPAPAPLFRPGQALSVPERAVLSGDLDFLDGCWLSEAFDNPVNGNASTKIYCFDANGNGQMSFRGVDGITCRAVVRARWEPGRRLVLDEPEDGTCGPIGPWHREITNCAIGGDGLARCNSYEFYRQFNYGTRMTRI